MMMLERLIETLLAGQARFITMAEAASLWRGKLLKRAGVTSGV
jgi:hypothetical protein